MRTQLRIQNHVHNGQPVRAVLQSVVYDAEASCWRARALWSGDRFMKRLRITAPTQEGLIGEAIKALAES